MFRLLLWSVRSGMHRCIAVLIAMNMGATGVATTIVTDSIAFPATVGTGARAPQASFARVGRIENEAPEWSRQVSGLTLRAAFASLVCWRNY